MFLIFKGLQNIDKKIVYNIQKYVLDKFSSMNDELHDYNLLQDEKTLLRVFNSDNSMLVELCSEERIGPIGMFVGNEPNERLLNKIFRFNNKVCLFT